MPEAQAKGKGQRQKQKCGKTKQNMSARYQPSLWQRVKQAVRRWITWARNLVKRKRTGTADSL